VFGPDPNLHLGGTYKIIKYLPLFSFSFFKF
jgi:hypothetical protein